MTVSEVLRERSIREVLHFTTNNGIVGTLAKRALMSRFRLPQEAYLRHVLHVNAASRPEEAAFFDKSQNWLDYVNLSISEINRRFFLVSQRWHENADVWWGILSFDSCIAAHEGVVFASTNNGYPCCIRNPGVEGLKSLFVPVVARKAGWSVARRHREVHLTTCEQAEILYPRQVSTDLLRAIYVQSETHHDIVQGWLGEFGFEEVNVQISPDKFLGRPN
ncbi:DarT ssDNA thymidine ADP-ribosyltransferase family protein [Reyranella sp.]|uniref:DarT ssDNA thymidine ADP-ribosyltransferase family protein n=1 Tax=Reyranella sp. TaxID=1929291 RepID=UPI003BA877D6